MGKSNILNCTVTADLDTSAAIHAHHVSEAIQ
jgi:hypothetical protein